MKAAKKWANETVQRKYESGMCVSCPNGTPAVAGHRCKHHAEQSNAASKRRSEERNARRQCVSCGSVELETQRYCAECAEKVRVAQKERFEKRLNAGLCGWCGKEPLKTKRLCVLCTQKVNNSNARKRKERRLKKLLDAKAGEP